MTDMKDITEIVVEMIGTEVNTEVLVQIRQTVVVREK